MTRKLLTVLCVTLALLCCDSSSEMEFHKTFWVEGKEQDDAEDILKERGRFKTPKVEVVRHLKASQGQYLKLVISNRDVYGKIRLTGHPLTTFVGSKNGNTISFSGHTPNSSSKKDDFKFQGTLNPKTGVLKGKLTILNPYDVSVLTFRSFKTIHPLKFETLTYTAEYLEALYVNAIKVKNLTTNKTQVIDSFLVKPHANVVTFEDFNFDGYYDLRLRHRDGIELYWEYKVEKDSFARSILNVYGGEVTEVNPFREHVILKSFRYDKEKGSYFKFKPEWNEYSGTYLSVGWQ